MKLNEVIEIFDGNERTTVNIRYGNGRVERKEINELIKEKEKYKDKEVISWNDRYGRITFKVK